MRQKVGYLESVNAELCEQLERSDTEALSHQGGLQAEKAELAARARQLQEEVRVWHTVESGRPISSAVRIVCAAGGLTPC
jgi:hypothetical protein